MLAHLGVLLGGDVQAVDAFAQHLDGGALLLARLDSSLERGRLGELSHLVGLLLQGMPGLKPD